MNVIKVKTLRTPLGELLQGEYEGRLCLLDWKYRKMREAIDRRIQRGINGVYREEGSSLFDEVEKQLDEYFHGKREIFDLPLLTVGSPFQKSVWDALLTVPYGRNESYMGLSRMLEKPEAVRAVASANGANAISIVIPCHRIIGSDGSLGGYAGGVPAKRKLLDLESQLIFNW